jgi:hypothetical protein
MKCIQLQGTKRCENDAVLGSNYCPAHMLGASDSSEGPRRSVLYSRIDLLHDLEAEAPCAEEGPVDDDPFTEEKWNPGPSRS